MDTDSPARRAQPVDESLNIFDIPRTLTGHSNVHSTDETDEKEDAVDDDYDSETNPLMKIDLFDESKEPETESEDDEDNDPEVEMIFPSPSMQETSTCPPTPRKTPLKNISGTPTPRTTPMRSKTKTP